MCYVHRILIENECHTPCRFYWIGKGDKSEGKKLPCTVLETGFHQSFMLQIFLTQKIQ
jgi:hypothetical protein